MTARGKVIRFPKAPPPPQDGPGFVEIRRCSDQSEALVIKGLFDSEAIPCLLRSRLVHSVHPFTVGDLGEITILVPEADAPRARLLLARISPGPSFPPHSE